MTAPAATAPPVAANLPAAAFTGQADQEIYELCDREDEAQVLAELSGRVVDTYIYSFPQGGTVVTGLSKSGVDWACREFAKHGEAIRVVSKPDIQLDPIDHEYIIISIIAQRFAIYPDTGREVALDSAVGVKRKWIKMELKDGSIRPDKFFVEKGVSMAQRNAKASLLPTDFIKKMVKDAIDIKNGKIPTPSKSAAPKGAPPQGAAAKAAAAASRPATPAKATQTVAKPAEPAAGAPAKPANAIGALRQHFWVVLKQAVIKAGQKDDEATCRKALAALTGKDKVSDLNEPTLKQLGPILRSIAEGVFVFEKRSGTLCIIDQRNGEHRWPPASLPAEAAPPPAESPFDEPPQGGTEPEGQTEAAAPPPAEEPASDEGTMF